MSKLNEFIKSGILELYVVGQTTAEESLTVERMALVHPEIRREIDEISLAFELYAMSHAAEPDPTVKPFLMATVNYMTRLEQGEPVSFPPVLHAGSSVADYAEWLNREDLSRYDPTEEMYAHIIGHTPEALTAIVWLKSGAPTETHTHELEKFLIVEGTCDIIVGETVHHLKAGDYLTIPLHLSHFVRVTSAGPCKLILQRVAA